jgi:hypothetical protein
MLNVRNILMHLTSHLRVLASGNPVGTCMKVFVICATCHTLPIPMLSVVAASFIRLFDKPCRPSHAHTDTVESVFPSFILCEEQYMFFHNFHQLMTSVMNL